MNSKRTTYHSYGNIFESTADIFYPNSVQELQEVIAYCKENNRKITLAGSFNSFDRQNSGNDAVISCREFKSIVYNTDKHTITVGAGAQWGNILDVVYANKSVLFTCITGTQPTAGGTLSVNSNSVWTPGNGKEGNHCISFKILITDGQLLNCSRTENQDLFYGAIGGLGLLGFIVEITYQTFYVGGHYKIETEAKDYENIDSLEERLYLRKSVDYKELSDLKSQSTLFYLDNGKPKFTVYNRCYKKVDKIIKNNNFLFYGAILAGGAIRFFPKLANSVVKKDVGKISQKRNLLKGLSAIKRGTFWAEPDYYWSQYFGKALFWLGYRAKLYQNSYFIPFGEEKVTVFTKKIMELIQEYKLQFFMFDIMYIPKDEPFVLSSSRKTDGFYVNTTFMDGTDKVALLEVYNILGELTLEMGGNMNLCKNCFIRPELLEKMHQKEIEEFVLLKQKYDSNNLLTSNFFESHFPSYFPSTLPAK